MQTVSLTRTISIPTSLQVLFGVLSLVICSKIKIPLEPIPITLQTLPVFLIGLMYPAKTALKTLGLWILMGLCSIPVFAGSVTGLKHFAGPSGGFLVGMAVAAPLLALYRQYMEEKFQKGWYTALIMALGIIFAEGVVFLFGVGYLAQWIGLPSAFTLGVAPFVLPELIKGWICYGLWWSIRQPRFLSR